MLNSEIVKLASVKTGHACTDQIMIAVEQSIWDSSLYINFVNCEKAFNNPDGNFATNGSN